MPGSTPKYGFPYPLATDTLAAFPGTIKDLAEKVEGKIAQLAAGELVPPAVETITPLPAVVDYEISLPPVTLTTRTFIAMAPVSNQSAAPSSAYILDAPSFDAATLVHPGGGLLPPGTWYRILGVPDPADPPTSLLYFATPF